jgi:predicted dehydrogenase
MPTPSASRRSFLKTSASTVAAGTLLSRGVHAAGSDLLKIGLIGCGGRGSGAAVEACKADANVKLYAMADLFSDRLEEHLVAIKNKVAAKVDVPPERRFVGFDAYKKVIECCDVVLLCTTPHFRPMHLKAAVDAGKHIFCEKPLAVDATGVRSVIASAELAAKKGLNLVSGFCYRYDYGKRETIKRIHGGDIGDVVAMHVNYNTGPIWHRGQNSQWSEMEYQQRNWYYFTWLSGDFIVEQHIHNMDKAAWVMNGQMPVSCVGLGGRQQRTDARFGNIYDHFSIIFKYENGARLFSNCRQMVGCQNEVSDYIFGTKGIAELMGHTISGATSWAYKGDIPSMYQVEHDELFKAIRSGKPINDGVAAAQSTLMGIMGRMAAYTGKEVTWKQAIASREDLRPANYDWGPGRNDPIAVPGRTKLV